MKETGIIVMKITLECDSKQLVLKSLTFIHKLILQKKSLGIKKSKIKE